MMFFENKHTRWYEAIIKHRTANVPMGYVERHHVIPRSLGGTDNASNIVRLTAREHLLCHILLTHMTTGQNRAKMLCARFIMTVGLLNKDARGISVGKLTRAYECLRVKFMSDPELKAFRSLAAREQWNDPVTRQKRLTANKHPKTIEKKASSARRANALPHIIAARQLRHADNEWKKMHQERTEEAMNRPEVKLRLKESLNRPDVKQRRSASQRAAQNVLETQVKRRASLARHIERTTFEERSLRSGTNKAVQQLDVDGNVVRQFRSAAEAGRILGTSHVKEAARGTRKFAGGFAWRYV